MINDFYVYAFFTSAFILYLIINDVKKYKLKLYNLIDCKIWIKLYILITLFLLHGTWLFFTLFSSETKKDVIYGLPPVFSILYILYLLIDIQNNKYIDDKPINKMVYYKINKYFNFIMSFYIIFIIILVAIPNTVKKCIIDCIKKYIERFVVYKIDK